MHQRSVRGENSFLSAAIARAARSIASLFGVKAHVLLGDLGKVVPVSTVRTFVFLSRCQPLLAVTYCGPLLNMDGTPPRAVDKTRGGANDISATPCTVAAL